MQMVSEVLPVRNRPEEWSRPKLWFGGAKIPVCEAIIGTVKTASGVIQPKYCIHPLNEADARVIGVNDYQLGMLRQLRAGGVVRCEKYQGDVESFPGLIPAGNGNWRATTRR